MADFRGLIAYPVTPFDDDGGVDLPELDRHLAGVAASGVDGIALLGSSGSFAYLDAGERREVLESGIEAVRTSNPGLPVYAGVSAVSTRELLGHVEDAETYGADGVLVSTVSYVPLTEEEVAAQCRRVAEATALPVCLYSNPGTTNFAFSLELAAELSHVPNIVALKEVAADTETFARRHEELRRSAAPGFAHGMAGDALIAEAGFAGDAWHSGPAALLPAHFAALRAAVVAGNAAEAARLRDGLAPLMHEFTGLRKLSNLYALARAAGVGAGEPRLPLLPVPGSTVRDLTRLLEELGEPL